MLNRRAYRVPRNPVLSPRELRNRRTKSLPPPLDGSNVQFFGYSRIALMAGLQFFAVKPGENILVPGFICSAAVAPLHRLGLEVRYYEVDELLNPILVAAAGLIDGATRAMVVVNYFGFAADLPEIVKFCGANGLLLVEDNAHGFLSSVGDRCLGTFGDMSVASLYKTVSLPNGAALTLKDPSRGDRPRIWSAASQAAPWVRFCIRNALWLVELQTHIPIIARLQRLRQREVGDQDECEIEAYDQNFSRLSSWILHHMDFEAVRENRRRAYLYWLDVFSASGKFDADPLFHYLPVGTVPYAFPLLAKRYSEVVEQLRRSGVEAFAWPNLPLAAPGWRRAEQLVLIPLHRMPDGG
jgi:DegT/DnrJ/EryC1/StrS aminotransferase family